MSIFWIILIINKDRSFKLGTHMYYDILSIIDRNDFFCKINISWIIWYFIEKQWNFVSDRQLMIWKKWIFLIMMIESLNLVNI